MSARHQDNAIAPVHRTVAEIARAPHGTRVGAFLDFDGAMVDGHAATALYEERVRGLDAGQVDAAHQLLGGARRPTTPEEFGIVAERGIHALQGCSEEELVECGEQAFRDAIAHTLSYDAWRLVKAHQRRGHTVVLVSSAMRFQLDPLARELGIEHVLCTPYEAQGGRLTGRLGGPVPWGPGKAKAIRGFAQQHGLDLAQSFSYTSRLEDVPLLELVGRPQVVNPGQELAVLAERRGWPVLHLRSRDTGGTVPLIRTAGAVGAVGAALLAGSGLGAWRRSRRDAVDTAMSLAGEWGLKVAGVELDVQGEHNLWSRRPAVFLINHQSSLIDLLILCKLVRRDFAGLAKKEAANAPIMGQLLRLADFGFVDRAGGTPEQLRAALRPASEKLRSGISLVVAPEGTRSYSPGVGPFKKGAFHLAMQARVPIVPIVARNAGELMARNAKTLRSGTIPVVVHPPIDVAHWGQDDLDQRIAEVRQTYIDTLEDWPNKAERTAAE
jgi:HAD superfamily hydrolase (TIGR01490 family)